MGKTTEIEYCDSTLNLMSGCNGCELWNPKRGILDCYAGNLITKYAGNLGYPESFDKPTIFPHRINEIKNNKWSAMNGEIRPDKPWLNNKNRLIFLNDMGDMFSPGLPKGWFAEYIPELKKSPHDYLLLTKYVSRMVDFFKWYEEIPVNFRLGCTVTNNKTIPRLKNLLELKKIYPEIFIWCSFEPVLEKLDLKDIELNLLDWAAIGGASRQGEKDPPKCDMQWLMDLVTDFKLFGVPCFVKQIGGNAWFGETPLKINDGKGKIKDNYPLILQERIVL